MLGKHSTTNPSGYVFILLIWHLPLYGILDTSNWTLTNGICYLHPKICLFQISFWHSNKPVVQIKILGKSSMTALVSPTLAKEHFNPNSWIYLKPGMVAHTKCLGGRLRFISEFKAGLIYIGSSKSVRMHNETVSKTTAICACVCACAHACMYVYIYNCYFSLWSEAPLSLWSCIFCTTSGPKPFCTLHSYFLYSVPLIIPLFLASWSAHCCGFSWWPPLYWALTHTVYPAKLD